MLIRIEENRVEKLQPRKFDDNNEINSISNFCINNNNNNNNNNSSSNSRSQTNNNKHLTETTSSSSPSSILTFSTFNNNYRKQSFHQKPPSNAIKVKNRQTININNNINQENQTIIKENNNNKKNQIDNNNNSSLKGNRFGILSFSGLGFRSDKPTNKITFNNSDNQKELLLLKDNSNRKENSIINSLSIKKRKSSYVVEEQELSSEIVAHKIVESTVEFERGGGGGGGGGGLPNAKKFKENHTMNEYMHSSTIDSSLRSSGALGSYILSKSDLNNIDDNTIMHTDKHYQQHNHINSSNSHHNQHHNNNNHHHHNHHNNNNSHNHHQSTNVLSSNASSNHQHQQYLNGISNSMATLSNIGNTCYLNSVIYTLRFAPFFLHNLHHLVDDLSQINKKIIQRQQTKVSSLGRNIGGLHGTNARSWSSKDLVSLGINSSYSTSMSSGIITSGTSTIGSKYQSSSSSSTSNSSSAVTASNITTVLPANGGGGTSAIEIDKTNRQIATEKLHELYRNLHLAEQTATNIEPFHADTFLSSIQAVSSIFEGNQQQDAHEFLMCLLDSIRETCQSVIKVICDCPDIIMNGYVNLPEQNNYEIMKPPKCIPAPKKNSFFSRKPKRKDTIVNKLSTGNNSAGVVVAQTQTQTQTTTTSITNTSTAAILVAGGQIKETESSLNSPLKSIQLNDSKSYKTTVDSVDGKLQNGNHRGGGGGGDRQLTTNEQQNSGDCGIISNANININNNIINNGNHNVENNSTKEKLNENIRKLGLDFFTEDFEGITVSTTKCLSCETITEQKETMIDLSIPITGFENMETNDKSHLFIQNLCITKEQFRGDNKYRCEQCLDYTEAIRTISYPILPRLLIIQLKRFSGGMEKINSYIPTQFLLQCFCSKCYALPEHQKLHIYKLYSVITHVGATLSVGHYIAYTCALNLSATNDTINNSNNNINNNNNSNSNNCNNINSEYLNCPKEKQQCIQGKLKILSMSSSSGGMGMGSNNNHNNNHSISTAINGGQSDIFDSKNINNINQKNGTVNNPLNSISSSTSSSTTTSSNNNNNSKYSGFVKKLIFGRNKASSSGDITKSVKNLNGDSGFNGNNNNNNGNNNNNNSSNSNSNSINDCIDNQLNIPCKSLHCCGIHMKVNQHSNGNQTGIIRNNDLITPITNHNHNHHNQHHHNNNNNNHHHHQHYNNNTDHHSSSSSSTTSSTTSALNANLSMSSVSHHYQKNPDAIWYMCDDDKIKAMSQIEFEDLLLPNKKNTITPYLLFYARIDLQSVVVNDQQQSHPQEQQQSQSPQKYHQEDSTVLQMYDFVTKL